MGRNFFATLIFSFTRYLSKASSIIINRKGAMTFHGIIDVFYFSLSKENGEGEAVSVNASTVTYKITTLIAHVNVHLMAGLIMRQNR